MALKASRAKRATTKMLFMILPVALQVQCHKFSVPVARNLTRTFSLPPSGNLPFTEAEGLSPVGPERSGGDAQRLDKSVSGGVLFCRKGRRVVTLNATCTVTGRATQHYLVNNHLCHQGQFEHIDHKGRINDTMIQFSFERVIANFMSADS